MNFTVALCWLSKHIIDWVYIRFIVLKDFKMRLNFFVIIFGITLTTTAVFAQDINQTDASGERHGLWEKYYPESNQLRFTGEFHHGKRSEERRVGKECRS